MKNIFAWRSSYAVLSKTPAPSISLFGAYRVVHACKLRFPSHIVSDRRTAVAPPAHFRFGVALHHGVGTANWQIADQNPLHCCQIGLIFYGTMLGYLHILPTLYLIVFVRSCFLFGTSGRWAVAGLSFMLFLVHQIHYVQNMTVLVPQLEEQFWMHLVAETLMFGLGLFLVLQLVNTLLSERQSQEALATAHQQLRQYAFQAEELATAQERNRIARDIHDSLGHALTALNVQLQTAVMLWQQSPLTNISKHAQATAVMVEIETTLEIVRLIVVDNGCGFARGSSMGTGFGLQGMRERIAALGGTFTLETEPGKGCRIGVEVPLTTNLPEVSSSWSIL